MRTNKTDKKIFSAYLDLCVSQSLTCSKCDTLALPLLGTRNRYKCPNCKRQFAAANHKCLCISIPEAEQIMSVLSDHERAELLPPLETPPATGIVGRILRGVRSFDQTLNSEEGLRLHRIREQISEIVVKMQKQ